MAGDSATQTNRARTYAQPSRASAARSQFEPPQNIDSQQYSPSMIRSTQSANFISSPISSVQRTRQPIEYSAQYQVPFTTYTPVHYAAPPIHKPTKTVNLYQPPPFTLAPLHSPFILYPPLLPTTDSESDPETLPVLIATKKKYKPVARKVRPVLDDLPAKFHIIRNILGDPLADLPVLNPHPPSFTPTGRYTKERMIQFNKDNNHFLLPQERALLHHFMMLHNEGFAWDNSERGHFREDFFPPIDIPVMKIDAGVFEPSNSLYCSRWFCVVKKDGKSLRIVQSLEPLNKVTIAHSGVPPFTNQLAEQFAGRVCNSMMDLY